MDDTVVTMDGAALMGGETITTPIARQTVVNIVPQGRMRRRR